MIIRDDRFINFIGSIILLSCVYFANITGAFAAEAPNSENNDNKTITSLAPASQPDVLTQINTLRKNNDLESAKSLAIEFLKTHPENVDVMLLLGLIYYQTSQYDQAEYFLTKVLDKSPTYLDAKLGLIRVKLAKKQYQEALNLIPQVVAQAPDNADVKQIQAFYQETINAQIIKKSVPEQKKVAKPSSQAPDLEKIRALIAKKDLKSAESLSIIYLKNQPDNADVMLFLGLIYSQKTQWDKAELYFHKVLEKVPTYLDAKLGLIRVKIAQKKYEEASNLIKQAVKQAPNNRDVKQIQIFYNKVTLVKGQTKNENKKERHVPSLIDKEIENGHLCRALIMIRVQQSIRPCDPNLIAARAKIFFKKHLYGQAANLSKQALAIDSTNAAAKEVLSTIKEVDPHTTYGLNEIGFASMNERVSDLNANWDLSTLYYTRETRAGSLSARMNYAKRLGESGKQGEIEFLPVFNQYFYVDLYTNFAKKPELFPRYTAAIEGYLSMPNWPTISLGPYYAYIINSTFYRKYTASLSKDIGKYWLSIRANHYVPGRGPPSILYIGNIRRYFTTNNFYLNLGFGYGTSPDLSDLETLNFIIIRNKFANLGLRFPLCNSRILVDAGVDYQHWKYPSGLIRILRGANIGFNYRF